MQSEISTTGRSAVVSGDPMLGMLGIPITRRSLLQGGLVAATGLLARRTAWQAPALRGAGTADLPRPRRSFRSGCGADRRTSTRSTRNRRRATTTAGRCVPRPTTTIPGMAIGELLPQLAKQADKFALIRSTTHGQNGHETAAYMVQTGNQTGGKLVYPHVGAVVSKLKGYEAGYEGLIPPYVVLTQAAGPVFGSRLPRTALQAVCHRRRSRLRRDSSWKGSSRRASRMNGSAGAASCSTSLNSLARASGGSEQMEAVQKAEDEAYDLILGDAGKVFDLSQESDELRTKYGRTTFGQSCLMARRLIEKGVRFITINFGGWDTHKENFQAMRQMVPQLDKGHRHRCWKIWPATDCSTARLSGAVASSAARRRCSGKRPGMAAAITSVPSSRRLIAGGGFKGGAVVGDIGCQGVGSERSTRLSVGPDRQHVLLMGIDPDGNIQHPQGMEVALLPKASDGVEVGGRLKEIM